MVKGEGASREEDLQFLCFPAFAAVLHSHHFPTIAGDIALLPSAILVSTKVAP